jgi:hypothetical protein
MIKREIVSYVKSFTPREDATQRFHVRILEAVIERVLLEMYTDLYQKNPNLLDLYTKTYGVPTAIAISLEATSGIYYSTIPVKIVNLQCISSGVRHIYTVVQSGNVFVPMDAREADLIYNTDVATVTSKIGYRVRQDTKVEYYNTSASIRSAGVRMDLLIPFSVYGDNDVVNIPELSEKEGGTFIQRVLKELQVIPPADLDDSNNNEAQQKGNNKQ